MSKNNLYFMPKVKNEGIQNEDYNEKQIDYIPIKIIQFPEYQKLNKKTFNNMSVSFLFGASLLFLIAAVVFLILYLTKNENNCCGCCYEKECCCK